MAAEKELLNASLLNSLSKDGTSVQDLLDAAELIISSFAHLKEESARPKATVYSVRELDSEEISGITDFIRRKLGVDAEVVNLIDKSLISGVKIVCGDKIIDGSLKHRLDAMHDSLVQ